MTAKLHKKYLCCAGHRGTGSVLEPIHVVKSWDHRIVEKKHYRKRCVMGDKTLEYLFFVFVFFFSKFPNVFAEIAENENSQFGSSLVIGHSL